MFLSFVSTLYLLTPIFCVSEMKSLDLSLYLSYIFILLFSQKYDKFLIKIIRFSILCLVLYNCYQHYFIKTNNILDFLNALTCLPISKILLIKCYNYDIRILDLLLQIISTSFVVFLCSISLMILEFIDIHDLSILKSNIILSLSLSLLLFICY